MRDYQQHLRTRRREIPKRKILVSFHTPEVNLSEIPYPIWSLKTFEHSFSIYVITRSPPTYTIQELWFLHVVIKLALRLIWSDNSFRFWVQTCYSQSTSSMEPFLFWSGPSLQTLLATNTNNVTCSLVVQFHRTMFHGHSSSDMSS